MKKQILIIAAFVLWAASTAFAQFVPRPVTCLTDTPLRPIAGKPYTYEVNVPTPPGTKEYLWFVTQDINFIQNGNLTNTRATIGGPILAAGSTHYNASTSNATTISLTWQSIIYNPANPIFVVINVTNTDVCVTHNLKVYKIEPLHAFSLDIANVLNGNVLGSDYGSNIDKCISAIQSARYDAGQNAVVYDFGADTLYYSVISANWSGRWQLRVRLTQLQTGQTADIHWGYTLGNYPNVVQTGINADGDWASTTLVEPQTAGAVTVGPNGEVLYIRLIIRHGSQYEGLTGIQYRLAVNGQLHDGTNLIPNYTDVHHTANPGNNECPWMVDFDDIALQTLKPRPDIQSVQPPAPGFLPKGN